MELRLQSEREIRIRVRTSVSASSCVKKSYFVFLASVVPVTSRNEYFGGVVGLSILILRFLRQSKLTLFRNRKTNVFQIFFAYPSAVLELIMYRIQTLKTKEGWYSLGA